MSVPRFRAFNKETKEIEPVLLICFVNWYVNVLPERNLEGGNQEEWKFSDIVLMQYTGMIDNEGKEICQGDVVRWGPQGLTGEVIYDTLKGRWYWQNSKYSYNPMVFNKSYLKQLHIIGNAHQNPELLK